MSCFLGLRTIPSEGCSCELSAVGVTAAGEGYALQRRDLGKDCIIHLSITMCRAKIEIVPYIQIHSLSFHLTLFAEFSSCH